MSSFAAGFFCCWWLCWWCCCLFCCCAFSWTGAFIYLQWKTKNKRKPKKALLPMLLLSPGLAFTRSSPLTPPNNPLPPSRSPFPTFIHGKALGGVHHCSSISFIDPSCSSCSCWSLFHTNNQSRLSSTNELLLSSNTVVCPGGSRLNLWVARPPTSSTGFEPFERD